ncbi:uncharacterized protein F5891DRAFT_1014049 [Suillus fuscotomentosus]|uniref:Letm1 RBD domain-containing protein n=1 Tax=Suillus fuscotomentosus TaxID=1912939 RepID=A0AAD4EDM4_9AGAM|nr:uncharacterized protein F5891DRAFT_1014049 [Suillus fuscotomentosus]KAG1904313.1 hypothetical protein F5891DRAFT_1014049 [Suillus fuscotomentosus]
MLRFTGKNVAVNSIIQPRQLHLVLSGQRLASGRLQLFHHARVGRKVSARSASTSTSSSNDKSSHASNLPPSAVPPRKHRQTQPSFPAFRPSPVSSTPESAPSAIELAKQDIADAAAKGVLRPAPHDAGTIKRFTHQAFELLKFYFRGLKAINTHRNQAAAIRSRIATGGAALSRAESRFIRTFHQDALKLIPFVIVVVVMEELIPFIALYVPRMLPSTCVLPGQRDRISAKARDNQQLVLAGNWQLFDVLRKESESSGFIPTLSLKNPGALCGVIGVPAWGPLQLVQWRLHRHLQNIASDDKLLKQEGYGRDLTLPELKEALQERGMSMFSERNSADELRAQLKWWIEMTGIMPEGADDISRRLFVLSVIGSHK